MKIGITDGSSDGMFGAGLNIWVVKPGDYTNATTEVTDEEWEDWQKFLNKGGSTKSYSQWEHFWDQRMIKGWGKK